MPKPSLLKAPGWSATNRDRLERLIHAGAGQHLPVVFDFDNTMVCGDIGEAVLAMLVRDHQLKSASLSDAHCPPFVLPDGKIVSLPSAIDLTDYYEALLAPTIHGAKDATPLANGYAWAVDIMRGLTVLEVARATQAVYALSQPMQERLLEVTPGKTAFPIPFFFPEMVELIAELVRHQFEVWIISASNVWSVRWMILQGLNPLLKSYGVSPGLSAAQVIGVSTLLTDAPGHLYKDAVLVRENAKYAELEEEALSSFQLTGMLQFPVPTYAGKVGVIWDAIGRRPYLGAGDSPGDHAMLSFCENRLWIARREKSAYQEATRQLIQRTESERWIVQAVASRKTPGFLREALTNFF